MGRTRGPARHNRRRCGLRRSEVAVLRWADVELADGGDVRRHRPPLEDESVRSSSQRPAPSRQLRGRGKMADGMSLVEWSAWVPWTEISSGRIQAPARPGVYEVKHRDQEILDRTTVMLSGL